MLGRGNTHKGKSVKEEGEEEEKWRRKVDREVLLWYAGLESLIHWHSPSLIQSNTNVLRKENKSVYRSNCIYALPAAVTVRVVDR